MNGLNGMHGAMNHLKVLNAKIESLQEELRNLEHTEENVDVQIGLIEQIDELYEEYREMKSYYEQKGMIFDKTKAEFGC